MGERRIFKDCATLMMSRKCTDYFLEGVLRGSDCDESTNEEDVPWSLDDFTRILRWFRQVKLHGWSKSNSMKPYGFPREECLLEPSLFNSTLLEP